MVCVGQAVHLQWEVYGGGEGAYGKDVKMYWGFTRPICGVTHSVKQ